ncbi:hypothetical protein V2A60_001839 [Cordyceps javanica]|uniref:Peroxidase n=1 Tax=Cordyceps javanica TaxID=43265 RepID=A0A545WDB4_9HYPO|nr:peroxidase [Cordyceps javanica]TQW11977.1 peroxidase [Cordyceps javanica]
MRSLLLAFTTAVMVVGGTNAYAGIKETIAQINSRAATLPSDTDYELIGDLEYLSESSLTPTGSTIKQILLGQRDAQDLFSTYTAPSIESPACAAETCCIWKHIADEFQAAMVGTAGRCNKLARGAVRLGYHDAGGWSRKTGPDGGADGSILLANECEERRDNSGLEVICAQMRVWWAKYKGYGISLADLIQMGATVGAVVCPQGPRVRSFVGREDNPKPAPRGNLPSPFGSADDLVQMFSDKTISPRSLIALLGAHTASQQTKVYPNRTGAPQDTTPGVWDTLYYRQTTARHPPAPIVRFVSDTNLAAHPRTKAYFGVYGHEPTGQTLWNEDYARAYVRLSLLGVRNINNLTECTHVLPAYTGPSFTNPDEEMMALYADGELHRSAEVELEAGDLISQ